MTLRRLPAPIAALSPIAALARLATSAAFLAAAALPASGLALLPSAAAAQEAEPNPTLPQVYLQAGIHRIKAEVADSPPERARGLMMRKSLAPNSGMLFVFQQAAVHCFWMKNTLIPLTIAFLDGDGTVVTLADMQPHDETSHCPERAVRYALEMEQGWFARRGIKAGDKIGGLAQPAK